MKNGKKLKCYYAHFVGQYNTRIEKLDIETLQRLGFDVINPNNEKYSNEYEEYKKNNPLSPMEYFNKIINKCDIFAYRCLYDKTITAGVHKELKHAKKYNKIIIELPNNYYSVLSVTETRALLGR